MQRRSVRILTLALCALTALPAISEVDKSLTMEIGDPARKDKKAVLVLDAITDTRTGELLSPAELAGKLDGVRLVLMGESHTEVEFHRAQLQLIKALHDAGRNVIVGLEMYPYTKQEFLDNWYSGRYTEQGFLETSRWYDAWGYHWDYYRPIFLFARDNGLPMYGLNTPRDVIAAVRKKGFDELTEEERELMPPSVDTDNDEHFALFKSYFEDEDFHATMTDEQWKGMFDAQCTWDATFGNNALKVFEKHPDPNTVLVVLVGSGHTTYDLGIQRQIQQWDKDLPIATVIPIPVQEWDEDEPIGEVQASFADFIWGMPQETDPIYPTLGISTRSTGDEGQRTVIYVAEDSVGEQAGFQLKDLLLSLDDQPIRSREDLALFMSEMRWGDRAVAKVMRGEEEVTLDVAFRRELPEPDEEDGE